MFAYIPLELKMLQKMLEYRVDFLDPFFISLNHLDTLHFYIAVGICCLTLLNPKIGIRLFILLAITTGLNYFLKLVFQQPRPLRLDPSLGLVITNSKYGLPSGGAQAAVAIAVFIWNYYKSSLIQYLLILYVILSCVTRIYIGMHFISDILLGGLIGFITAKIIINYGDFLLKKINNYKIIPFLIFILISVILFYFEMPKLYKVSLATLSGAILADNIMRNFFNYTYKQINKISILNCALNLISCSIVYIALLWLIPRDFITCLLALPLCAFMIIVNSKIFRKI